MAETRYGMCVFCKTLIDRGGFACPECDRGRHGPPARKNAAECGATPADGAGAVRDDVRGLDRPVARTDAGEQRYLDGPPSRDWANWFWCDGCAGWQSSNIGGCPTCEGRRIATAMLDRIHARMARVTEDEWAAALADDTGSDD